jgi:hypothetical protein
MFKSKEELKTKGVHTDSSNAYDEGIEDAFKSIAERIEFYGKYRNDFGKTNGYEKFREDFPKMICDFTEHSWFNDWLFEFCFDWVK